MHLYKQQAVNQQCGVSKLTPQCRLQQVQHVEPVLQVVSAGGLFVLGTSLQEGERIELQLRGRAGRQGDPGSTQLLFDVGDPLITTHGMQSKSLDSL